MSAFHLHRAYHSMLCNYSRILVFDYRLPSASHITLATQSNLYINIWFFIMHKNLFPPLGNVVGIAVGVSIAGFVLLVVLPIGVVIGCCCIKHRSSRRSPTTVTTTTQPVPPTVTVNTTNIHGQQGGFQSYPAAGTDVNQAPPQAFEMSAYPPPLQAAYLPPAHTAYTPTYPPRQA